MNRWSFLWENPNIAGFALATMIPIPLSFLLIKGRVLKIGASVVLVALAIGVLLTGSRGALVGIGVYLFLYYIFRFVCRPKIVPNRREKNFTRQAFGIIAGLAAGLIFFYIFRARIPTDASLFNDPNVLVRLNLWKYATVMAHDHPWHGVGHFGSYLSNWFPVFDANAYFPTAISDPLTFVAIYGLMDFSILLIVLSASFGFLLLGLSTNRSSAAQPIKVISLISESAAGVLVIGGVCSIFSSLLGHGSASWIFWGSVACGLALGGHFLLTIGFNHIRSVLLWCCMFGMTITSAVYLIGAHYAQAEPLIPISHPGIIGAAPRNQNSVRGVVIIQYLCENDDDIADACRKMIRPWVEKDWIAILIAGDMVEMKNVPLGSEYSPMLLQVSSPDVYVSIEHGSLRSLFNSAIILDAKKWQYNGSVPPERVAIISQVGAEIAMKQTTNGVHVVSVPWSKTWPRVYAKLFPYLLTWANAQKKNE